jgi:SAM-dependent methyltransferase
MEETRANNEQIEFWDGAAGDLWVRNEQLLDGQLAPFAEASVDVAQLAPGHTVLDIGCGCGATTLLAAQAVGANGCVTGVDLSEVMLTRATERARDQGLENAHFLQADAQVHAFKPGSVDAVISRFGVMFFDNPTAAFANIAASMRSGARMSFACWQRIDKNPWMMVPVLEALSLVKIELPSDPDAPGPFALADDERTIALLEAAGLTDIDARGFEPDLSVAGGQDVDASAAFLMELGPMRRALMGADDALRAAVREAIAGAITPFETPDGVIMPSAAWIMSATKP